MKEISNLINKLHFVSSKIHMYHWNVSGANFLSLHKFFEESYKDLLEFKDELAEYLRFKKLPALIDFNQVSALSKNFTIPAKSSEMLTDVLKEFESLIADYSNLKGGVDLEGLESNVILALQKRIYFIQSILS